MRTRLLHVRANVRNLQESVKWYEDTLGLLTIDLFPAEKPKYAHFDAEEGATFGLIEEEIVDQSAQTRFHFYLENIEELWAKVQRCENVTIIDELFVTPRGTMQFTIADPDGNELGFVQKKLQTWY